MFHDKNLHHDHQIAEFQRCMDASFELCSEAVHLMMLVQWFKRRGEKTLPVEHIKRMCGWKRTGWRNATKGRAKPGSEIRTGGLEATGLITEVRQFCKEKGHPVTVWVIGEISAEVLNDLREEREQRVTEGPDVIEDEPEPAEGKTVQTEITYEQLQAAKKRQYALGYQRGVMDTAITYETAMHRECQNLTSLVLEPMGDEIRRPEDPGERLKSEAQLGF